MASMNGMEEIMRTANEANSVYAETRDKTFDLCNSSVNVEEMREQLEDMGKMKVQVKDKFVETFTRHFFMESLTKPPSEWPELTSQADGDMRKAKQNLRDAKEFSENQKNNMLQLNSVVVQGSSLYQFHMETLRENIHTLEQLLEEVRATQKTISESGGGDGLMNMEIQKQCSELEKLLHESRKELLCAEHQNTQLRKEVVGVKNTLQQLQVTLDENEEAMDASCLARMQKAIADTESLSGITCHMVNPNTVVLEFPPRPCDSQLSTAKDSASVNTSTCKMDSDSDLVLKVTMIFTEDGLGYLQLSGIESNTTSFGVSDLWAEYCENGTGSLPQLVSRIKERWFSHVPLLAEINNLRCRYAIDWIQKENILRVIVGKGGGIVCSLEIPPTYPHQGYITLSSILGAADSVRVEDLKPQTGLRLEDWVHYLEETFGKP